MAVLLIVVGYGSYRAGYSKAINKDARDYATEYGNDWKSDPTAKHSAAYSIGYSRGNATAWAETHNKDVVVCGDHLAQLAVEAGNVKVAGKWLAEGFFAPEQLQAAEDQLKGKH